MTATRAFPLADVLSITTGRLLTRGGGAALDRILSWTTGDHLSWWQAPRAADACTEAFAKQHPFLADLVPPDGLDKPDLYAWLAHAETEHGTELTLTPLTDWVHQDPAQELLDRVEICQLGASNPVAATPDLLLHVRRGAEAMDRLTTEAGASAEQVEKLGEALRAMGDQEGEQQHPMVGRELDSRDPEPPVGTIVRCLGEKWGNLGKCWGALDRDSDSETWQKIAGNYGPVTVMAWGGADAEVTGP